MANTTGAQYPHALNGTVETLAAFQFSSSIPLPFGPKGYPIFHDDVRNRTVPFDPWEAYTHGHISAPVFLILGEGRYGKTGTMKMLMTRLGTRRNRWETGPLRFMVDNQIGRAHV